MCDTIVGVLQTFPFKHTLIDVYHINIYQMYLSPITLWRIISILILFVLSTGENRVLAYSLWGIWLVLQGYLIHIDFSHGFT